MSVIPAGGEIPVLAERLRAARDRLRAGALLTVVLWTAAALLVVLVARGLGDVSRYLGVLVVLVAVGGFAGLALALVRLPSRLALAQQADRQFGLGERLSTAVETAGSSGADSVVRALHRDAEQRAGLIDLRTLAPIWRGGVIAGGAALLAAIVLWFVAAPAPAPPAPASIEQPADAPVVNPSESIATLAERIAEDAVAQDNPYLQAVADSLESLAAESGLSPEQLEAALGEIMEHARLAYGERQPGWLTANSGESFDYAKAAQDATSAMHPYEGQFDEYYVPLPDERNPEYDRLDGLRGDLTIANDAEGGAGVDAQLSEVAEATPAGGMPQLMSPEPQAMSEEVTMAGAPVGAASQSGAGDSRLAGGGSKEIGQDTAFAHAELSEGGEVLLPTEPENTGSRIRIHMPTDINLTAIAGGGFGSGETGEALTEAPVRRDAVQNGQRPAIARYFGRAGVSP